MIDAPKNIEDFSLETFLKKLESYLALDYEQVCGNELIQMLDDLEVNLPPKEKNEVEKVRSTMDFVKLRETELFTTRTYVRRRLFLNLILLEFDLFGLVLPEGFENRSLDKQKAYVRDLIGFLKKNPDKFKALSEGTAAGVEKIIARGFWKRITGGFPIVRD